MLFNSLHYLIFLPVVVTIFFLIPPGKRWVFLLAASYYFYMCWKVEYIFLILAATLINYFAGLQMGKIPDRAGRRKYLVLSVCASLAILFAFKYFNFFSESVRAVFQHFNIMVDVPFFKVLLPVGISFYTFQCLSYTISVYRGVHPPERHLGIFALYVAFFPQLVAGPIERSSHLLPQFYQTHRFEYDRVTSGIKLIMWGMFKKVVVADRVAIAVSTVYGNPQDFLGIHFIIATWFFAFQVYCDFSGYSDIAIGSARIMGYELMTNFRRPYWARSIGEFWQRWHISLSTWFRDYVYIPLGGNRRGRARFYFNIMVTFLASGLWHGASWNYVLWGGVNGVYVVIEAVFRKPRQAAMKALGLTEDSAIYRFPAIAVTFSLTCLAFVIFCSRNMSDAVYVYQHLHTGVGTFFHSLLTFDTFALKSVLRGMGMSQRDLIIAVLSIAVIEGVHLVQSQGSVNALISRQPVAVRWAAYYLLIAAIVFLGAFNQSQQFIYFQF